MKRSSEWEKISANRVSVKGLIPRIRHWHAVVHGVQRVGYDWATEQQPRIDKNSHSSIAKTTNK